MSELVQIKKQLTFEQICPLWSQYLSNPLGGHHPRLCIDDSKYCIVGEAHGWHSNTEHRCMECRKFSFDFCYSDRFETLKTLFVEHWNEKHV